MYLGYHNIEIKTRDILKLNFGLRANGRFLAEPCVKYIRTLFLFYKNDTYQSVSLFCVPIKYNNRFFVCPASGIEFYIYDTCENILVFYNGKEIYRNLIRNPIFEFWNANMHHYQ